MLSRLSDDAVGYWLLATFILSTILIVLLVIATALFLMGVSGILIYAQVLAVAFPCAGSACAMLVGEAKRRKGEG